MLRQFTVAALLACFASSAASAGCSCSEEPQVAAAPVGAQPVAIQPAADPAPAPEAPAPAGAVTGKISFEGTPPARDKVDLSPDPVCHKTHGDAGMLNPVAVEVDAGGGLKNVFVQLTGVPESAFKDGKDAPPATIDQVGCNYVPHVLGVLKKQPINILNSDPTLHNIHGQPRVNKEFNYAMPNKGDVRDVEFKKVEEAVKIKCDVHAWMAAFCFVMEHPYFAVTTADGSFTVDTTGLADGEYGVKAWHEILGTAEGKVTVKDGAGTFSHTFKK